MYNLINKNLIKKILVIFTTSAITLISQHTLGALTSNNYSIAYQIKGLTDNLMSINGNAAPPNTYFSPSTLIYDTSKLSLSVNFVKNMFQNSSLIDINQSDIWNFYNQAGIIFETISLSSEKFDKSEIDTIVNFFKNKQTNFPTNPIPVLNIYQLEENSIPYYKIELIPVGPDTQYTDMNGISNSPTTKTIFKENISYGSGTVSGKTYGTNYAALKIDYIGYNQNLYMFLKNQTFSKRINDFNNNITSFIANESSVNDIEKLKNAINTILESYNNLAESEKSLISSNSYDDSKFNALDQSGKIAAFILPIAKMSDSEKESYYKALKVNFASVEQITHKEALSINEITTLSRISYASGDENLALPSAWLKIIFGKGKQQTKKLIAGYENTIFGCTIGADYYFTDQLLFGISLSDISSKYEYTDILSGDEVHAKSLVISLYNNYDFTNELSSSSIISYGWTKLNGTRNILKSATALGESNNRSFMVNTGIRYKINVEDMILTPSLGVEYIHGDYGVYKEHGSGSQNSLRDSYKTNDIYANLAGKISVPDIFNNDPINLTPEIYASMERRIKQNSYKIKNKFLWMNNSSFVYEPKIYDTNFNLGFNIISLIKNKVECRFNYDFKAHKKYSSHQLSIAIKLILSERSCSNNCQF